MIKLNYILGTVKKEIIISESDCFIVGSVFHVLKKAIMEIAGVQNLFAPVYINEEGDTLYFHMLFIDKSAKQTVKENDYSESCFVGSVRKSTDLPSVFPKIANLKDVVFDGQTARLYFDNGSIQDHEVYKSDSYGSHQVRVVDQTMTNWFFNTTNMIDSKYAKSVAFQCICDDPNTAHKVFEEIRDCIGEPNARPYKIAA